MNQGRNAGFAKSFRPTRKRSCIAEMETFSLSRAQAAVSFTGRQRGGR
jgi:hypothetical protein